MKKVFATVTLLMCLCAIAQTTTQGETAKMATPTISEEAFGVLKCFYDYDREIPLEPRTVDLLEESNSVRRKIVYRGAHGFLVPAYLEIPKHGVAPYPVVILIHGWSGSKENWLTEDNFISGGYVRRALLKLGYALFAIDAQGHGDRIAENDYQVVNLYNEAGVPPRKNFFTLRDIVLQTTLDYRRGIDYLETRSDIDTKRLGALGYSMGGFHTFVMAALEPRIKVAVGCVVPVSWRSDLVLDPASYIRGFANTPYLMIMGKTDELCNEAQAKELYSLIQSPNTSIKFFDSGHQLPVGYVEPAVAWIRQHLPSSVKQ